ncbi:hypothetical protein [Campylobacter avium]|uniref:hypothetical protein n=1 Tax=Campylobacter avium TaxID=522485 RepID=UPI0023545894|nr:hypothetical protein [Campylobacter avium]
MLVLAVDTFFAKKNDVVFKAQNSDIVVKHKEDFSLKDDEGGYGTDRTVKFFSDNKEISVKLNKQSLELLKDNFSNSNFIDLGKGVIALSGIAASFVDSWYKDISISRNFLNADLDNNNKIEGDEFLRLKSSVEDASKNQDLRQKHSTLVLREALSTNGYMQNSIQEKAITLDDLLNESIRMDKDMNGSISRLEYAANGGSEAEGYKNWALKEIEKILGKEHKEQVSLVLDPHNTISPLLSGKGIDEVYALFKGHYKEKVTSIFEDNNIFDEKIEIKTNKAKSKEDEEKERLKSQFPELRVLIDSNPNISKESLTKIQNQRNIAQSYQQNETNLNLEFSKAFLAVEINA